MAIYFLLFACFVLFTNQFFLILTLWGLFQFIARAAHFSSISRNFATYLWYQSTFFLPIFLLHFPPNFLYTIKELWLFFSTNKNASCTTSLLFRSQTKTEPVRASSRVGGSLWQSCKARVRRWDYRLCGASLRSLRLVGQAFPLVAFSSFSHLGKISL